jgi:hypothetical protein
LFLAFHHDQRMPMHLILTFVSCCIIVEIICPLHHTLAISPSLHSNSVSSTPYGLPGIERTDGTHPHSAVCTLGIEDQHQDLSAKWGFLRYILLVLGESSIDLSMRKLIWGRVQRLYGSKSCVSVVLLPARFPLYRWPPWELIWQEELKRDVGLVKK